MLFLLQLLIYELLYCKYRLHSFHINIDLIALECYIGLIRELSELTFTDFNDELWIVVEHEKILDTFFLCLSRGLGNETPP